MMLTSDSTRKREAYSRVPTPNAARFVDVRGLVVADFEVVYTESWASVNKTPHYVGTSKMKEAVSVVTHTADQRKQSGYWDLRQVQTIRSDTVLCAGTSSCIWCIASVCLVCGDHTSERTVFISSNARKYCKTPTGTGTRRRCLDEREPSLVVSHLHVRMTCAEIVLELMARW